MTFKRQHFCWFSINKNILFFIIMDIYLGQPLCWGKNQLGQSFFWTRIMNFFGIFHFMWHLLKKETRFFNPSQIMEMVAHTQKLTYFSPFCQNDGQKPARPRAASPAPADPRHKRRWLFWPIFAKLKISRYLFFNGP